MVWDKKENALQNLSSNEGIVLLYANANLKDSSWSIEKQQNSIQNYFFIPARFFLSGGKFRYNFNYKYVKRQLEVYHNGIRYTEPVWNLEDAPPYYVELMTDKGTKLPYLILPDDGLGNHQEKCYFIPLHGGI